MDEDELKKTVGETAFNAMSAEQRTTLIGKFSKPDPKPDPKPDLKKKAAPEPSEEGDESDDSDDGLLNKAKNDKKSQTDKGREMKRVETAVRFNLGAHDWLKTHKDLLPSEIEDIFKISDKENYESGVEKANALRDGIIQSFFAVQSNMDLLTASQKSAIDDYLKLTKNGREQKAEFIFENFFEPALEMMKRVKKAEEVGRARAGFSGGSTVENNYKERLMKISRKTYLGEKASNE